MDKFKKYGRTKKGVLSQLYGHFNYRHKRKNIPEISFTKDEFVKWVDTTDFNILFNAWIKAGHTKELKPSVDRIKDDEGYFLHNMQIITWDENNTKGYLSRRHSDNKNFNGINQYSNEGKFIDYFTSIKDVAEKLKINYNSICNNLTGYSKSAGTFIFKYADKKVVLERHAYGL